MGRLIADVDLWVACVRVADAVRRSVATGVARRVLPGITTGAVVTALLVAGTAASAQDVRRGEHVFRKCALCHVTTPDAKDLIAPPLHNIMGRRAATIAGFDYSDIMKTAGRQGLVWSTEALYYFLDRPEEFIPGTYMAFSGLDEQERRDVIAYLEKLTADWKRSEARSPKAPPGPAQPPQRGAPSFAQPKVAPSPRPAQPAPAPVPQR